MRRGRSRKRTLENERKNRENIKSSICTEASCPSRRSTFEELVTCPKLGGADASFSLCCAACACG
jgi:hypothetical protein